MERLRAFKQTADKFTHLPHLEAGQDPIFCTVEDLERISTDTQSHVHEKADKENVTYLDYKASPEKLSEEGILSSSEDHLRYLISTVDGSWKISDGYYNCQGLVVSGLSEDGERIAFMTHHNPALFSSPTLTTSFLSSLEKQLTELQSRTRAGTVDAAMFGGDAFTKAPHSSRSIDPELTHADEYRIAAEMVAETVQKTLGFTPRIAEGPRVRRMQEGKQSAIFDTEHNHLHIIITGSAENSGEEIRVQELPDILESLRDLELKHFKKWQASKE